jgi:DNA-binding transcriptional regulator YdaS (Cro superfamily)
LGIVTNMTIKEYLKTAKIGRQEFAHQAGTTLGYLSHIINGRRQPSIKLASKIIHASRGNVTLADLRPDVAQLR